MAGTWSAGSNVGYATYQPFAGGGPTSAFAACGGGTAVKTSREWNGTTWSAGDNTATARTRCASGDAGTASNALICGGFTGSSVLSSTEEYNGTAWATGGTLATARQNHILCGNASNALAMAGRTLAWGWITTNEAYNGAAWSSSSTCGERGNATGGGNSTDAFVCGGEDSGNLYLQSCKTWNGSAWADQNNLNTGRKEFGGGGTSAAAICFGGTTGSISAVTEEWDGTSWAAGGNLNTARRLVSGGAGATGDSGSGISISGYTTTSVQTVETYEWTLSSEELIRILSENRQSSSGRITRFKPKLLWSPPTVLTTPTYDGSGQAVHPSVVYISESFAGYKYWMGITPYPGGNDDYENPSILASNDGVTWAVPDGITNPLAPKPSHHNSDCCLVWDASISTLYLYYVEMLTDITHTIYRFAITEDPLTVSTKVQCLQSSSYLFAPAVVKNGTNDWVMWVFDGANKLHRYISADGVSWSSDTIVGIYNQSNGLATSLTLVSWHLSVTKRDDRYLFFICAYPAGGNNAQTDLYWAYADSIDSPIWFDTTAILNEFTGWGNRQVYLSCMTTMENGTNRLYISAATTNPYWRTGYADISLS